MCLQPLRAFDTGYLTDNGKPLYKICGSDVEFIKKPINSEVVYSNKSQNFYNDIFIRKYKEIPCGKCIQCRINYTRTWAIRCYLECLYHEHNYMVTLTYNNENVPIGKKGILSLKKKDFQDFMKRLRIYYKRKYNHENIRFFKGGEYGEETERPHEHFIGFNLPVYDLEPFFFNEWGQQVYKSKELAKIWGKGNITVCEANWNTCAYVARYVLKKKKGEKAQEYYQNLGIEPESVSMSLKPGIGQKYYEENKHKIFENDEIKIKKLSKDEKGFLKEEIIFIKPPKYYTDMYEKEYPEFIAELKKHREKCSLENKKIELSKTTKDPMEYYAEKMKALEKKIKDIKREKFKE